MRHNFASNTEMTGTTISALQPQSLQDIIAILGIQDERPSGESFSLPDLRIVTPGEGANAPEVYGDILIDVMESGKGDVFIYGDIGDTSVAIVDFNDSDDLLIVPVDIEGLTAEAPSGWLYPWELTAKAQSDFEDVADAVLTGSAGADDFYF